MKYNTTIASLLAAFLGPFGLLYCSPIGTISILIFNFLILVLGMIFLPNYIFISTLVLILSTAISIRWAIIVSDYKNNSNKKINVSEELNIGIDSLKESVSLVLFSVFITFATYALLHYTGTLKWLSFSIYQEKIFLTLTFLLSFLFFSTKTHHTK